MAIDDFKNAAINASGGMSISDEEAGDALEFLAATERLETLTAYVPISEQMWIALVERPQNFDLDHEPGEECEHDCPLCEELECHHHGLPHDVGMAMQRFEGRKDLLLRTRVGGGRVSTVLLFHGHGSYPDPYETLVWAPNGVGIDYDITEQCWTYDEAIAMHHRWVKWCADQFYRGGVR